MGLFRDSVVSAIDVEREKVAARDALDATRTTRLRELIGLILEDHQFLGDHNVRVRDGRTGMVICQPDEIVEPPIVLSSATGVIAEISFDTEKGAYRVIDWEGREPGAFDEPRGASWFSDISACVKALAALLVKNTNVAGHPE